MEVCVLKDFQGKNYYFKSKKSMKDYFVTDGENLLKALDEYVVEHLTDDEIDEIKLVSNNIVFCRTNIVSENLRDLYNFNLCEENENFKLIVNNLVYDLDITENKINDDVIYILKKRILRFSNLYPFLLNALELDDSILRYFLIKSIRKLRKIMDNPN